MKSLGKILFLGLSSLIAITQKTYGLESRNKRLNIKKVVIDRVNSQIYGIKFEDVEREIKKHRAFLESEVFNAYIYEEEGFVNLTSFDGLGVRVLLAKQDVEPNGVTH